MAVHASHMSLPFPVKGARFSVLIPYLDADGDPTDPVTPDTEITKDGAAAADCTEDVGSTIITGTGLALMTFTGDETNCSGFGVHAKVASGPKATLGTWYPRVLPVIASGTAQAGSSTTMTLEAGTPGYDLRGCIIKTTGGTGGGGGSGSLNNQARVIVAYDTSGLQATVDPAWEVAPNNTTTYQVLCADVSALAAFHAKDPNDITIGEDVTATLEYLSSLTMFLRVRAATAQGGTSTTITLDAGAWSVDDIPAGSVIYLTGAPGYGQSRVIVAYNGTTKVATVDRAWATNPSSLTTFVILPTSMFVNAAVVQTGAIDADAVAADAVTEIQSGLATGSALSTAQADLTTLIARITAARAGYWDNLNVGGPVASSAEATAIQNNTRVVRVVPSVLERPDSGSTVFRIELLLYDAVGNMEAPDSAPTISVVDESGSSRDANLDSTTMSLVSTGRYRSTYTVGTGHDVEELIFAFSVVEGGAMRVYANAALVVDTTAVDFTASDRTTLNNLAAAAALESTAQAIKTKTDGLNFTGTDIKATLDGETVVLTDGSLTAAKIATGALSAIKFAADACNKIADHVRRRAQANVEASSDGDSLDLSSEYGDIQSRQQANTTDNPCQLTVLQTDGTTELGRLDLATDAGADPVTGTEVV